MFVSDICMCVIAHTYNTPNSFLHCFFLPYLKILRFTNKNKHTSFHEFFSLANNFFLNFKFDFISGLIYYGEHRNFMITFFVISFRYSIFILYWNVQFLGCNKWFWNWWSSNMHACYQVVVNNCEISI